MKQCPVVTNRTQLPYRRLPEMVHECVLSADDPYSACRARISVVVVLGSILELFVQATQTLPDLRRMATQNIVIARMSKTQPSCSLVRSRGKVQELPVGAIRRLNLRLRCPRRFVTGPTSPIAGSARCFVSRPSSAGRHNRVVVQQHQHAAGRERQAWLFPGAKPRLMSLKSTQILG